MEIEGLMEYLFLYSIAPAAVSFLLQSIACHKADRRVLRYGTLAFPVIFLVLGCIMLLSECGGIFGGLGVMGALLYLCAAFWCVFGYGVAWMVYVVMRRIKRRKREE